MEKEDGSVRIGFFGKLPSRGDFVRVGLSRPFVAAWDGWLQSVWTASTAGTETVTVQAPAWRFAFAAGLCGPRPVAGLWLPSADKAGRLFPLMIAAEAALDAGEFLDAVERIGEQAIRHSETPERLAQHLHHVPCPHPAGTTDSLPRARWWRANLPQADFESDTMPDRNRFLDMLRAPS